MIGAIVVALFGGLLTRLWFLQVTGGETLAVAAQRNSSRYVQVPAVRGTIYDATGTVLAQTVPVTTLTVDRQKLTTADRATLETNLGKLLNLDAKHVDALIDNQHFDPFVPVPVATKIDLNTAIYVSEHRDRLPAGLGDAHRGAPVPPEHRSGRHRSDTSGRWTPPSSRRTSSTATRPTT